MKRMFAATALIALASCGGSGGGSAGGGSTPFQPGQWETTTQLLSMSLPDMPKGAQMPLPGPTTVRTCMTEEQAARPNANFLTASGENGGCRSNDMSMSGGRIQGTVQCEHQGATAQMTLDGQFTATTFEVNQQMRTQHGGTSVEMEARTTGRRIGDCPSTT